MTSDPNRLLDEMTLDEKAALVSGADFWHTVAIDRLDVPAIMCSDGPHGLRAQPRESDHVGLSGSEPVTCSTPNKSLQRKSNSPSIFAVAKTGVASNAAELRR